MKKILNKILVAVAFTVIAVSCKKADLASNNPFADVTNLGKGAYLTFNSSINYNLNYAAINPSRVGIKVDA